ncbi:hypothetical protein CR513_13115, partial [Mucuna pruriens]
MRRVGERELELHEQPDALKVAVGHNEPLPPFMFCGQPFSEHINNVVHLQAFQMQVYISCGDNLISCKLFPGTLKGVTMRWFSGLSPHTIHTFNDLVAAFISQFATNRAKMIEVTDFFDIKQTKSESLKQYLTRFNSTIIQVDNLDQKFFCESISKGPQDGLIQ